ncbi:hypothetical protein Tco_1039024 [Tanacetum coccineum]
MENCDPVDTLMVEKSKLDEDPQGKVVDPTCYRGMIGTIIYLTSIKRIFRYLRGTINIGLWYSKDSCIALTAFADVKPRQGGNARHNENGYHHNTMASI